MIRTIRDLDLRQIADSGQCFRMHEIGETGYFKTVAGGKILVAKKLDEDRFYFSCSEEEFDSFWFWYFALDMDYGEIRREIRKTAEKDGNRKMTEAIEYGRGIRILRQDFWETAISYIISQNNSIPRISRAVENLSRAAGQKISVKDETMGVDTDGYTFPTPAQLMTLSKDELYHKAFFYRIDCLYSFVKKIGEGRLDLDGIGRQDYGTACSALMEVFGIGPKVADCICLYGLHHLEAFPVDTWVRNTLFKWHGGPQYKDLSREAALRMIISDHYDIYGGYRGIAQQYLFYYEREAGKSVH